MTTLAGPTGPTGSGMSLFFISDRVTNTSASSQLKNWLLPWGLTVFPNTAGTDPNIRIYPPFSGNIKQLRATRRLTAGDLTFGIEVNGSQVLSLLLPGGTGAAVVTDNISTAAFTLDQYISVSLTAATPDTTNLVFPQLVFMVQ